MTHVVETPASDETPKILKGIAAQIGYAEHWGLNTLSNVIATLSKG